MPGKYEMCEQCGSILKTPVCMKCGYDSAAIAEVSSDDETIEPSKNPETKAVPDEIEAHEQVRSIFTDIAIASGVVGADAPKKGVQKRFLAPLLLFFVFSSFIGASYWRFIYFTPEYVSPLVLSAEDIKAVDGAVESTASTSENPENEKTIELDSGLEEGNFATGNFAQFGAPNTQILIQAFNIKNVFKRFEKEQVLKELQDGYKVSDDDLEVYFSKGFAYFVPGENLDTWGFVIGVNVKGKEYVEKRVAEFKVKKENPKYKFAKYSAALVEISVEKVEESTESAEEKNEETEDSSAPNSQLFLLISNSKEYLDQMKEASEGNLTNLANEATYARSKVDLPQVGEVMVYKEKDTPVWATLADVIAGKYSYVGLDKILKTIQSVGLAFYSVDSKLKISLSEN